MHQLRPLTLAAGILAALAAQPLPALAQAATAAAPSAAVQASGSPTATGASPGAPAVTSPAAGSTAPGDPAAGASGWDADDRAIAARFAPVFHQGMVGSRFDFITNVDFDGDWVGDNNWVNAGDAKFAQKAYVYYAVSETPTHYFIHYAAYHPRDYKGGELTGAVLSQAIRRGAQSSSRIKQLPIANDVVLAHENDLEGCLVVVRKQGTRLEDAVIVYVETLAHNRYLKFQPSATMAGGVGNVRLDGLHPEVYIEPKGHGMEAYADQLQKAIEAAKPAVPGDRAVGTTQSSGGGRGNDGLVGRLTGLASRIDTARRLVNMEQPETIRVYRYTGTADDPEKGTGDVGYDLLPTYHTMWARARRVPNETYGEAQDYGSRDVKVAGATPATKSVALGSLGSAFRGVQGAENKARPPWGWFDMSERDRPLGEWFFDPATAVLRHFPDSGINPAYVHQPFLGVIRTTATPAN